MKQAVALLVALVAMPVTVVSCSSGPNQPPLDLSGEDRQPGEAGPAGDLPELLPQDAVGTDLAEDLGEEQRSPYPDPAFFHKVDATARLSARESYQMDEPRQYRTIDELPNLDVRRLTTAGGKVRAGTAGGLMRYSAVQDRFEPEPLGAIEGPVTALAGELDAGERLAVATSAGTGLLAADGTIEQLSWPGDGEVVALASSGTTLLLARADQVATVDLAREPLTALPLPMPLPGAVRSAAADGLGGFWLATSAGLVRLSEEETTLLNMASGDLPEDDVRALLADDQVLWIATASALGRLEEGPPAWLGAGPGALPCGGHRAIAGLNGRVLLGHDVGATAVTNPLLNEQPFARVDHYASGRWLPDNEVRAVAIDGEERLWLGTAGGISRVEWRTRNLKEKADKHEEMVNRFWRMDGFVSSDAWADDPWEPTSWSVHDKDNDGLWTQMQIGAWCYAYAATGEQEYYLRARKAMEVMMMQVDLPAITFQEQGLARGFVTRSLVRDDEGEVYSSKATQPYWHAVSYEGRDYFWKDDTSSDEIDGHFFGYPLFFDLCAQDQQEREEVAAYAAAIADYIIAGDYLLIDLDGEKTTHGHWSPETIGAAALGIDHCLEQAALETDAGRKFEKVATCYGSWSGGGWVNSTQILGTLLAAWHMTGESRFYDEYEHLVTDHNYGNLVMPHEETLTITSPSIMNHSDHELAMLAYHTLIRYEPNTERRDRWVEGLLYLYDHEREERNPLWTAFVALLAGPEHAQLQEALGSLREMPDDRRCWTVDNSHRVDAGDWPPDRFGRPQFDRVFPYDEIGTVWWNGNLYRKQENGNPQELQGAMAWLLPYYALRYAGVIGE